MRIGLFGGEDYDGAILVNACTGETTKYALDEVPSWCDKVFTADLVYGQLGYYGKYRSGFIQLAHRSDWRARAHGLSCTRPVQ